MWILLESFIIHLYLLFSPSNTLELQVQSRVFTKTLRENLQFFSNLDTIWNNSSQKEKNKFMKRFDSRNVFLTSNNKFLFSFFARFHSFYSL